MTAAPKREEAVMGLAQTEAPSLYDSAVEAWAARAALDERSALNSFQHQLWTKVKVRRDSYEPDLAMFPDEALPFLRLGVVIDGLTFCMDSNHQLSIVNWQCSAKGCERRRRAPFTDRVSLGRQIALGDQTTERFPRCDQHA